MLALSPTASNNFFNTMKRVGNPMELISVIERIRLCSPQCYRPVHSN